MAFVGEILILILSVFFWIIIAQVVLSWLIAFDVINVKNAQARNLIILLNKITDPIFKPLRKIIPAIGGIDITPIFVIIALQLLQGLIGRIFIYGAL